MGRNKELFVAIEGIDAAGKKTQTVALNAWLKSKGLVTSTLSFPVYGTVIGREIRRFLAGKVEYPPQVRAMLYAANRWEQKDALDGAISTSDVVVVNRYIGSNLAYGVSAGLGLDWLQGLEAGLPLPDLVLVLDTTPARAALRRRKIKDSYERDETLQSRARRAYLKLAAMLGWTVIDADGEIAETAREVQVAVAKLLDRGQRVHRTK